MGEKLTNNSNSDPIQKAVYFANLWQKKGTKISVSQKDEIGLAYLEHILGENKESIEQFLANKFETTHLIGIKQAQLSTYKNDRTSFWQRVNEILGGIHSDADIEWLKSNKAEYHILLHIDQSQFSGLIRKIHNNAIPYK